MFTCLAPPLTCTDLVVLVDLTLRRSAPPQPIPHYLLMSLPRHYSCRLHTVHRPRSHHEGGLSLASGVRNLFRIRNPDSAWLLASSGESWQTYGRLGALLCICCLRH